jgi:hypothetical protein
MARVYFKYMMNKCWILFLVFAVCASASEKCNFDKYCEYAQKDLVATNIEHHLAKWSSTTNDLPVEVRYNQEENVFGIYQKENAQTLGPKKGTQKAIPIY